MSLCWEYSSCILSTAQQYLLLLFCWHGISERTVGLRSFIGTKVKLIAVWISFFFCFLDSKLHLGQRWKALSPPEVEDYWQVYGPHTSLGGIAIVMGQSTFCWLHNDMWSGGASCLEAKLTWKYNIYTFKIYYYKYIIITHHHLQSSLTDIVYTWFRWQDTQWPFYLDFFSPDLFQHCLQVMLLETDSAFRTDSRVIFVSSLKPWQ